MGIKLNWADQSAQQLTAIEIYRGSAPISSANPGTPLVVLAGTATQYEDNNVKNKTRYYYRVAAVKGSERSWGNNQLAGYFSETGPGRATPLRGSWDAGLMDVVAPGDFITLAQLRARLPKLAIGGGNEPTQWYKMVSKGKVFFFPNSNIVTANWQTLYAAGLVYGTNDTGTMPAGANPGVALTNQYTTVNIRGLDYIVRCPSTTDAPLTEFVNAQEPTVGSEWRNTLARLVQDKVDPSPGKASRLGDADSLPNMFGEHFTASGFIGYHAGATPETYRGTVTSTSQPCALLFELIMP
ncbi:putative virion structural protein [Erwinia phage vB_EamM_Stratton]|uniref:Putative virion structural protein n=1 Tax=Erwinia phage vB_EamM_Stratton TaxID=1883378 RepID=A0A1B2IH87_9CAUD|nr:putative virion structural protein [Erwinia phage vB_EamM_Stratton]